MPKWFGRMERLNEKMTKKVYIYIRSGRYKEKGVTHEEVEG